MLNFRGRDILNHEIYNEAILASFEDKMARYEGLVVPETPTGDTLYYYKEPAFNQYILFLIHAADGRLIQLGVVNKPYALREGATFSEVNADGFGDAPTPENPHDDEAHNTDPEPPAEPNEPTPPVDQPDEPSEPIEPETPVEPPVDTPDEPTVPEEPVEPEVPANPLEGLTPFVNNGDGTYTDAQGSLYEGIGVDNEGRWILIKVGTSEELLVPNELIVLPSEEPIVPEEPKPEEPAEPSEPVEPSEPEVPTDPETPSEPIEPTEPETPVEPENPEEPTVPEEPKPEEPVEPELEEIEDSGTDILVDKDGAEWVILEKADGRAFVQNGEITKWVKLVPKEEVPPVDQPDEPVEPSEPTEPTEPEEPVVPEEPSVTTAILNGKEVIIPDELSVEEKEALYASIAKLEGKKYMTLSGIDIYQLLENVAAVDSVVLSGKNVFYNDKKLSYGKEFTVELPADLLELYESLSNDAKLYVETVLAEREAKRVEEGHEVEVEGLE